MSKLQARVVNPRSLRRLTIGAQVTNLPHILKLTHYPEVTVTDISPSNDTMTWKIAAVAAGVGLVGITASAKVSIKARTAICSAITSFVR